jgi:hypothetical protein
VPLDAELKEQFQQLFRAVKRNTVALAKKVLKAKQGSERQPSCQASRIFLDLHRFISSLASALFTSDWKIRNCRAIRDGVKPALNAARIAFSFP